MAEMEELLADAAEEDDFEQAGAVSHAEPVSGVTVSQLPSVPAYQRARLSCGWNSIRLLSSEFTENKRHMCKAHTLDFLYSLVFFHIS